MPTHAHRGGPSVALEAEESVDMARDWRWQRYGLAGAGAAQLHGKGLWVVGQVELGQTRDTM